MKIITGSRASGKTEALIRYAHDNKALILCSTRHQCNLIKRRAMHQGLDILDPMVFSDFFKRGSDVPLDKTKNLEIVIDELPSCLRGYFEANISLATGTIPTMHPQDYINLSLFSKDNEYIEFINEDMGIWNLKK